MDFIFVLLLMPLVLLVFALSVRGTQPRLLRPLAWLPFASILVLLPVSQPAQCQEIIHARAGQLVALDAKARTLTLKAADGSTVVFHDVAEPEPAMSFNKDVRRKAVSAGDFHTVGAYVVVFYFGLYTPTAVAVEDLGTDVPQKTAGAVAAFDRHKHLLRLKTENAAAQELTLSDDTVVDTPEGVVKAADFHPSKGDNVRCFAKAASQSAVFVTLN